MTEILKLEDQLNVAHTKVAQVYNIDEFAARDEIFFDQGMARAVTQRLPKGQLDVQDLLTQIAHTTGTAIELAALTAGTTEQVESFAAKAVAGSSDQEAIAAEAIAEAFVGDNDQEALDDTAIVDYSDQLPLDEQAVEAEDVPAEEH